MDQKGHRRKPLEKVVIRQILVDKPRCKRKFPHMEKPTNIIFHNYEKNIVNPETLYKKTKVSMIYISLNREICIIRQTVKEY